MEKKELIDLLNNDIDDEHAAIVRYLVHAYQEGEETPIGVNLLSRCREEMWHMHWLGMAVCQLGGEPMLTPAPYPYDPTNRATIFKSYIEYEKKLVPLIMARRTGGRPSHQARPAAGGLGIGHACSKVPAASR